jgi:PEP-CTERM motif
MGLLPIGTYFRLGDPDQTSEIITLQAFDASGTILSLWLDEPVFLSGPDAISRSAGAMPEWTWNTLTNTYRFTGDNVNPGGNPLSTISLLSNQAIASLIVGKPDVNVGFGLAAPSAVPEPGTWTLIGFGLSAIGVARRKRGNKLSSGA